MQILRVRQTFRRGTDINAVLVDSSVISNAQYDASDKLTASCLSIGPALRGHALKMSDHVTVRSCHYYWITCSPLLLFLSMSSLLSTLLSVPGVFTAFFWYSSMRRLVEAGEVNLISVALHGDHGLNHLRRAILAVPPVAMEAEAYAVLLQTP